MRSGDSKIIVESMTPEHIHLQVLKFLPTSFEMQKRAFFSIRIIGITNEQG